MEQTATTFPQPRTDEEYIAEVDRLLAEIEQMSRETRANHAKTEQAAMRTQANLEAAKRILGI